MSFDHPQGLWLLVLGIPILVFHFYKGRVRRMPVPTLLFWEQVLIEEERKTALRRLRHVASLLLNLAALFVLTSAVSVPNVRGLTRPKARYAILLDNTASLGALAPEGRTRLAVAVDRAREFIRSLAYGDQVAIHDLAGARAPFTTDLERAARRLTIPPPVDRADLRDRIQAVLAAGDDVTAVLFTDAPPVGVDDLLSSGRLRVAAAGGPIDNTGWVSGLVVRRPGEKRVTLSLSLAGFAAARVERTEILLFNRKPIARRVVALEPGEQIDREWVLDPSAFPGEKIEEGGLAEVVLEPRDAFAADDVASFVIPPLVPPQVIVFSAGKPGELLMSALGALATGGIVQHEILTAPVASYPRMRTRFGEGWVVIFDRVAPPAPLSQGGTLILGAASGTAVERPTIADWDRSAPPNRMNDYAGLLLRRSRILQGTPLLRAVEGPVATWSSGAGRAVVETGFAFEDAEPRPALPILLFNFVEWAAHRGLRSFRTEYRVGEPIRTDRPLWLEEGEVTVGQADRAERVAVRGGQLVPPPVAGPGFVQIGSDARSEWAAVNLFDPAESDFRPREGASPGPPLPPPAPWHAKIPYAVLAVAVVLALLLLEWWLFHRGMI
jgi:aerotolerance regulator-like protein